MRLSPFAMPFVVAGYESEAPGRLGNQVEARIIWDKLGYVLEAWPDTRLLIGLRRFLQTVDKRWRVVPVSG